MFEIKGKINTALCYAKVVEDEAIEQIRRMCDYDFTQDSRIAIMPDVHAGKGCTIGTTMTVKDRVVPNIVGVDIGCGMYTVNLGKVTIDFEKLDEAAHFVPSGTNVWEGRQEKFDLTGLRCYRNLKDAKRLVRSLGTLGGGNHFIEVDEGADGTKYLVIHSGSRNLGKQVAEFYQQLAIELHSGKEEYFKKRDALISEYKAAGRRSEIQDALKQLHWEKQELRIPEDLCYVYEVLLVDFLILNRDRHGANLEVVKNNRTRKLYLAPLFDHGLSLLFSCHSEAEIRNYNVLEDKPIQCFLGGCSAAGNLELIPSGKFPKVNPLQKKHKAELFVGLEQIMPFCFLEKTWEMLWKRWESYEDFCNQRSEWR